MFYLQELETLKRIITRISRWLGRENEANVPRTGIWCGCPTSPPWSVVEISLNLICLAWKILRSAAVHWCSFPACWWVNHSGEICWGVYIFFKIHLPLERRFMVFFSRWIGTNKLFQGEYLNVFEESIKKDKKHGLRVFICPGGESRYESRKEISCWK